jgi:hypothetical protein
MWYKIRKSGYFGFILDFEGNAFSCSPFSIILTYHFVICSLLYWNTVLLFIFSLGLFLWMDIEFFKHFICIYSNDHVTWFCLSVVLHLLICVCRSIFTLMP